MYISTPSHPHIYVNAHDALVWKWKYVEAFVIP
jgi:hypothetical protein